MRSRSAQPQRRRFRPGVLPGFGPTLAVTLTYLSLLVLIPLAGLVVKTAGLSWRQFWSTITSPPALAAYRPRTARFEEGALEVLFERSDERAD